MRRIFNFLQGIKHQDSKRETYENLILASSCLAGQDKELWKVK